MDRLALTHAELDSSGKATRQRISREDLGEFRPPDRDPVQILVGQNATRLEDLIPVRFGRMLQSPFAYYRGTAAVMAADLAGDPVTQFQVVSCGDAHVSNFGFYASPERRLLFDLNDFDEAGMAPWEWDVKRLAASAVIGGRHAGYTAEENRTAAERVAREYRLGIRALAEMTAIERYYFHIQADDIAARVAGDKSSRKVVERTVSKATRRTSDQVLARLATVSGEGHPVIVDQPPITRHVDHGDRLDLERLFADYRSSLRADVSLLLSQFRLVDYVLRVVGVGSVGTRCYVVLFIGPSGEPLFLQAKEAPASVLETHGGIKEIMAPQVRSDEKSHQGYRVVTCQRVLQAHSDPFLGWIEGYSGDDPNRPRADFYWRQFRDMKGSVELDHLSSSQFEAYAALCARVLARAHAQSPLSLAVAAYLGKSESFDSAIASWAVMYADQVESDFERLARAASNGEIPVEYDV